MIATAVLLSLRSIFFGLMCAGTVPLCFHLMDRLGPGSSAALIRRAKELGLKTTPLQALRRFWPAVSLGIGAFFWLVLEMWPVAIVASGLLAVVPSMFIGFLIERRRVRLRDQLVTASRALVSQFLAGKRLANGLAAIATEAPSPLAEELGRCVRAQQKGKTVEDALTSMKERLKIEAVSLFVVTLLACERRGGNVAEALERINYSLEQIQRIEQKAETNTAGGRTLVSLLSSFPAAFVGLFCIIDPHSMKLVFETFPGQMVLSVTMVITFIAFRIARWMVAKSE